MGIPSGQGLDAMELSWVDFQIYTLCALVFCLYVCLCSKCLPGSHRGQRRVSCPLELELWVVVSLLMVAEETKVWSSTRASALDREWWRLSLTPVWSTE